LCNW
jgi:hypothetical protein